MGLLDATDFKCPTRSTLQIRCRRTAIQARRSRIRANADYGKALEQPTPLNVLPQPPVASPTAQLRQLLFFGQTRPAQKSSISEINALTSSPASKRARAIPAIPL